MTLLFKGSYLILKSQLLKLSIYQSHSKTGHVIHSVPMVVIDHGTDLIIGANMVKTYKWASYWEEGKYFIDVGKDLTPVQARFQPIRI
jgi:hypothetical protein